MSSKSVLIPVILAMLCILVAGTTQTKDADSLIQDLEDNSSIVRWQATKSLGEIRDAKTVEPVILALRGKDSSVRRKATWLLESSTIPQQSIH
jgi:HEAT repeat protein